MKNSANRPRNLRAKSSNSSLPVGVSASSKSSSMRIVPLPLRASTSCWHNRPDDFFHHNTFNYTNTTRAQLLMRSYPSDLCYFEELFFSILVIDPSSLPHLLLLDIASLSEQPTRTLPACTLHSNFYSLLLIVFDVVVSPSRDHTSGKNG